MTTAQRAADVIAFPVRTAMPATFDAVASTYRRATVWTAEEVDDWGRDNGFVDRVWSISKFRWHIAVGGTDHVPRRAGALIVVNARRLSLAPVFAALSIGAQVTRPVRFVGRPDVAPIGPIMQRLGGLLHDADELEGVLRAGELVVLGAEHEAGNHVCGLVDHRLVGAAIAAGARVLPTATTSVPNKRNARVEIGRPVSVAKKRRGPLAELETADAARARIDAVLNELGGTSTGTPLDWLPIGFGGL